MQSENMQIQQDQVQQKKITSKKHQHQAIRNINCQHNSKNIEQIFYDLTYRVIFLTKRRVKTDTKKYGDLKMQIQQQKDNKQILLNLVGYKNILYNNILKKYGDENVKILNLAQIPDNIKIKNRFYNFNQNSSQSNSQSKSQNSSQQKSSSFIESDNESQ